MSLPDIAFPSPVDSVAQASRLERLLASVGAASAIGDFLGALRFADAAHRITPEDPTVALVYARLLIDCGEPERALAATAARLHPDALAVRAEALVRLRRTNEARSLCLDLLSRFALDCVEGLAGTLDRLCELMPDEFVGWVGVDSQARVIGCARAGSTLTWKVAQRSGREILERVEGSVKVRFTLSTLLRGAGPGPLHLACSAGQLLGSPLAWPSDFGYSGWIVREGKELSGEVRGEWASSRPVTLVAAPGDGGADAADDGRAVRRYALPAIRAGLATRPFVIPVPAGGRALSVSVLLPDGRLASLCGSPPETPDVHEVWPIAAPPARGGRARRRSGRPRSPVDIVVPVYAGREETLRCLRSVLDTVTPQQAELVVVNDASPESALCAALAELANERRITLLVNESNLGFPGAVNRGMRVHPERDVVLLNSDSEVHANWLERLARAAYSAVDVASATPLGERASIASYQPPSTGDDGFEAAPRIDAIAGDVNAGQVFEVPVGVGFCMYLRRECLDEVGQFDESHYGRGYGEENEWCLQARRKGWRHVVAADVFVRHSGGRSFGAEAELLRARNRRVLNRRHPGYDAFVAQHLERDPLLAARRAIDLRCAADRLHRTVLLVTHDLGGGIQRVVDRRADDLAANGHGVVMLQPLDESQPGVRLKLRGELFENLRFSLPADRSALDAALRTLAPESVEFHHLLHVPDEALAAALCLGVPYRVYLHDYSWICPRLCLLGGQGRYCGEPQIDACEACARTHGSAFPPALSVAALRSRSARLLASATEIVGATQDVRARYERHFSGASIAVRPWGADAPLPRRAPSPRGERVRVAVVGAVNVQKGYGVLLECARTAAREQLALEFVLIGFSSDDEALLDTGRVFVTGRYEEQELAGLLRREACHVALLPSVTPETWCFTLSHLLDDGLPIVAFDIGAVGERLRGCAHAALLSLDATAEAIDRRLLQMGLGEAAQDAQVAAEALERGSGSTPQEGRQEVNLDASSGAPPEPERQSASVQMLQLPAGVYAFSIRGGASAGAYSDEMALPALHVGLAPVRSKGSVNFFSGPATADRWLAFAGDTVVAQVLGESAGLLLTSIRRPQDAALAIDVRRIDVPLAAAPGADLAAATRVLAHVRQLGDLHFPAGAVGPVGSNLWIEALIVTNADEAGAERFEYRGVTADGFETPWLSNGVLCGSRGRGTPLLGFAVRPRVAHARSCSCSYVGYFRSGRRVGPVEDGGMCRSDLPDDPLLGFELRIAATG